MESYKELVVWQKTIELVPSIYQLTATFPKAEIYGLSSQIQRSATAIPANIAEGWGRGQTREYMLFLRIARGSLLELETHLIVAQKLGYLKPEKLKKFSDETEEIGRMLNGLIASLRKKLPAKS